MPEPVLDGRRYFLATFVCTWTVLVATSPGIPIVWDEGEYLARAQNIIEWFRLLPDTFSRERIQAYWLFLTYAEGHPAGFALPIALTRWLATPWLDPLTAARLGPITLFSLACAAIAMRLKDREGPAAAIVAPVALITFPRIFSEAHFATQDGQLTAWWLLLWVAQTSTGATPRSTLGLGVVLGLTMATKFTGWLAWPATIVSELLQRRAAGLQRLAIVVPLALLIFFLVNPTLWFGPLDGLREHFHRTFDRAQIANVTTQFLGTIYSVDRPLPWYNTLVWLVFTTPLPTFVLGLAGLADCLVKRNAFSAGLLLHWATLMIVRALPGAPPHDGIRLFLPAFGFWCVLAGIGAQRAFAMIANIEGPSWRAALHTAIVAALTANAINVARYYPQTLSHYSLLAGGLRGAVGRGMEAAYWWDGFDNDLVRWLNEQTSPGEAIAFSPIANTGYLRDWRGLRPTPVEPRKSPFKWYVLQNRAGTFSRIDRRLMLQERPAFVKYAGRRRSGTAVPPDLRVPLVAVFSYEQYQRVRAQR